MWITTQFTNNGIPATSLNPSISAWRVSDNNLIEHGNMSHISNGLYKYNFSTYDDNVDYIFQADGGETLLDIDRYQFGNNEIGQVTNQANSISSSLNSELMIIAGLVQRNQRITDCVYDGNGNLIQSTLSIYSSAQDAELEETPIKQFRMDAIYNNNELTNYLMKEL